MRVAKSARLFSVSDVGVLLGIPVLLALAWLVPERYWRSLAGVLGPSAVSTFTSNPRTTEARIARTLGGRLAQLSARSILRGIAVERIIAILQILRSYRPFRRDPRVRLGDAGLVEQALRSGRGVILWVAHGPHGDLGAKAAFSRAGLAVSHLSTPGHGFSSSRFGKRYLNRLHNAAEDRHLKERILTKLDGSAAAVQAIVRRLRENRVVSITAHRGFGRVVEAPFLDGMLKLAPGAPSIAHMTGAALLPVFAFREDDGVVGVTFGPPIAIAADRPRDVAVADAARRYAEILEPHVLRHPAQWQGWLHL